MKKKRKKKQLTAKQANLRMMRRIVLAVLAVVVLLVGIPVVTIYSKLAKVKTLKPPTDIVKPEDENFEQDVAGLGSEGEKLLKMDPADIDWSEIEPFFDDDLINIMLIGQDRREGEARQRSDSMILCSINPDNGKVSLISFMRDLYVQIPGGYSDNRLNAAYAFGGFPLLADTIYTNFGITIDGSVEVDFSGFSQVIDTLGGVDIQLTAQEAEVVRGGAVEGMNHLDGEHALQYARIRKIDNDFNRTQRQRNVLETIYKKFRNADAGSLMQALDKILPCLSTDLSSTQILLLAAKIVPDISSLKLSTYRIPSDDSYYNANIQRMAVLVPDLEKIHDHLEKEYLPLSESKK